MSAFENLHKLVQAKDVVGFRKALEAQPSLLSKSDDDGRTPLQWVLSETQDLDLLAEVLKVAKLPESKFDIDHADNSGFTALHIATALGSPWTTPLLDFNPNVNALTNNHQSPLFMAVSNDHPHAARFMLERGASAGAKDVRGITPLHRAGAIGTVELVELLLKYKAPVNATDAHGWTALHYAYSEGRTDAITILLAAGADKNKEDEEGHKPEQVAATGYKYSA